MAAPCANQDYVCEMCGNEGFKHCLVTCPSCGAHQHMYCMPEVIMAVPNDWQCDECLRKTESGVRDYADDLVGSVDERLLEYPVGPSVCCFWKGRFKIHDEDCMDLDCGLQAHPPPKTLKKIYQLSLKLPEELQLTIVPRSQLGTNMFRTPPTKDDIALYFFCSDDLGCSRYIQLLELMNTKDLVLSNCPNGVELIVLSSKLLPFGSQYWLGRPFMWAVFRRLKKHKNVCKLNTIVDTVDQSLTARDDMVKQFKFHLTKAQQLMKQSANICHSDSHLQIGDCVFVQMRQPNKNSQLVPKFGPFIVLRQIGDVSYKLQLPINAKILNVSRVHTIEAVFSPKSAAILAEGHRSGPLEFLISWKNADHDGLQSLPIIQEWLPYPKLPPVESVMCYYRRQKKTPSGFSY